MRAALVMILCFALAAPAVAQSSLGTPNALPPPQRPGGATPAPP
ncbi:MAG: hypothetical protein JWO24_2053, partial [Rhodospirillales bacterium]|nr:hypothetical protein [Rhodospirillales bacterium]